MKKQKRNLFSRKLSSYVLVGLAAFSTEYISFIILIALFPSLLVAQTVSFLLGLIVSFSGNRSITFKRNSDSFALSGRSQLWRYSLLATVNLVFTNIFIYLLVDKISIDPVIAKVLVMVSVVVWNYILFNKVIFRANK